MSLSGLATSCPRLAKGNHRQTSPVDRTYNCIAHAAGDQSRFWWPVNSPDAYWPVNAPLKRTLRAFELAFKSVGYRSCDNGAMEPGYEKIAVYVDSEGRPTHAARQLTNGRWTSKCGKNVDIEHDLDAVGGGEYGEVALFMRRQVF